MPTYEYQCRDCGHGLEAHQSFHDDPLTECPTCGGDLRKKLGAPGIAFKGSGFYRNDSRVGSDSDGSSSASKSSTRSKETTSAEGASSGSDSGNGSDSGSSPTDSSSTSPTSTSGASTS